MKTFLRFLTAWVIYVGIAAAIYAVSMWLFPTSKAPEKAWGMAVLLSFPIAWKVSRKKKEGEENSGIA